MPCISLTSSGRRNFFPSMQRIFPVWSVSPSQWYAFPSMEKSVSLMISFSAWHPAKAIKKDRYVQKQMARNSDWGLRDSFFHISSGPPEINCHRTFIPQTISSDISLCFASFIRINILFRTASGLLSEKNGAIADRPIQQRHRSSLNKVLASSAFFRQDCCLLRIAQTVHGVPA